MNNLEKLIFLDITNKQFGNLPNSEYLQTFNDLSELEKDEFYILSNEIHQIWNIVNSKEIPTIGIINSIEEYNDKIQPISNVISQISSDFNLTFKNEISEEFKKKVIEIFGIDYFNNLFSE